MRRMMAVAASLLLVVGFVQGDPATDARAIIDKAITAQGGAANLGKFKGAVIRSKGRFHGMGQAIDYTSEDSILPPDQQRLSVEAEMSGVAFKLVRIVNGDKGWRVVNGQVETMTANQLAEAREMLYAAEVRRLVPLTDKGYKLSPLGETKVGDRPAIGVRVEHKGRRDINLYFDKQTHLLVRTEMRIKAIEGDGQEHTAETLFADYKKVQGVQMPFKVTIRRDGKPYVEVEHSEVKLVEKLDEGLFARP
jgi:outer membrane lipoprotein-sorting protein